MLTMDQTAAQALRQAFGQVDTLSRRLQEWVNLDEQLQKVEMSFKQLSSILASIETGGEFLEEASSLVNSWRDCQEDALPELENFAQTIEHVARRSPADLPAGAGAAAYPNPKDGIEELLKIASDVQEALPPRGGLASLKTQAAAFRRALAGQKANCRRRLSVEVNQLCRVSYQLWERLAADSPSTGSGTKS